MEQFKNTFIKGMDKDIEKSNQDPSTYRSAKNLTISNEGDFVALSTTKGTTLTNDLINSKLNRSDRRIEKVIPLENIYNSDTGEYEDGYMVIMVFKGQADEYQASYYSSYVDYDEFFGEAVVIFDDDVYFTGDSSQDISVSNLDSPNSIGSVSSFRDIPRAVKLNFNSPLNENDEFEVTFEPNSLTSKYGYKNSNQVIVTLEKVPTTSYVYSFVNKRNRSQILSVFDRNVTLTDGTVDIEVDSVVTNNVNVTGYYEANDNIFLIDFGSDIPEGSTVRIKFKENDVSYLSDGANTYTGNVFEDVINE